MRRCRPSEILRLLSVVPLLAASTVLSQDQPEDGWLLVSDGKETFVIRQNGEGRKKAESPAKRPFKPLRDGYAACVLSPDKSQLVYVESDGDTELFLADVDGKSVRKLTDNRCDDGYPAWFPDGKRIAFASSRSGKYHVYVMLIDGSDAQQLTEDAEGGFGPCVSRDGKVAYVTGNTGRKLVVREGTASKVVVEDSWISNLAWSPDGRSIAYVPRSSADAIAIHDLETQQTRRIKAASIHEELSGWEAHSLSWRPDGRAVAFRASWQMRNEPPSTFAEHKLFVAPLDGKATWVDLLPEYSFDWVAK